MLWAPVAGAAPVKPDVQKAEWVRRFMLSPENVAGQVPALQTLDADGNNRLNMKDEAAWEGKRNGWRTIYVEPETVGTLNAKLAAAGHANTEVIFRNGTYHNMNVVIAHQGKSALALHGESILGANFYGGSLKITGGENVLLSALQFHETAVQLDGVRHFIVKNCSFVDTDLKMGADCHEFLLKGNASLSQQKRRTTHLRDLSDSPQLKKDKGIRGLDLPYNGSRLK